MDLGSLAWKLYNRPMTIDRCRSIARPLIAAFAFAMAGVCAAAEDAVEFSKAETLLWMTDQLQSIEQPLSLSYRFDRTGSFEPGFTDSVRFNIEAVHDDRMKAATLEFFTGERRFEIPPAESTNVNPILKVYLQGDVYEMNRLTDPDGKSKERWRYFQRRIKFALAESAEVKDIKVAFNGREYGAQEVSFRPYVDDPKRSLFDQFADKTYSVVISDEIPGYLYKIETVVPGAAEDAPPLIHEVLTLIGVDVKTAKLEPGAQLGSK